MKHPLIRRYTLVELLVVIAVIVILAAILFPVARSARETAKRTQCVANEKNIGVYVQQYAYNHNQRLDALSNWKYWYRNLIEANGGFNIKDGAAVPDSHYLSFKDSKSGEYITVTKCSDDSVLKSHALNAIGLAMAKVFVCPSDVSIREGAVASYGRNDPKAGGTLKYKAGSTGSSKSDAIADRLVDSRMNDINHPSDLVLVADHWGKIHRPGESDDSEEYESNNVYHLRLREGDTSIGTEIERDDVSRHRGTPPIVFVDGHVTTTNWRSTIPPRFQDLLKTYGGSDGLGWQGRAVGS